MVVLQFALKMGQKGSISELGAVISELEAVISEPGAVISELEAVISELEGVIEEQKGSISIPLGKVGEPRGSRLRELGQSKITPQIEQKSRKSKRFEISGNRGV
jgi:hypothetical protein